jgi:aerobic carbon-monoxide dehydrogenase small subunit
MKEHPWVVLNGERHPLPTDGRRLIDWLRDDMGLTGSKEPCGAGHCGGCSVLLDGEVVLSCCILAATVAGRKLTTIEGLAEKTPEDPLLDAFVHLGAIQCGYCTPGMVVAARAFLNTCAQSASKKYPVDEQAVRLALSGNICRCTGYVQIIKAVLSVAQQEGPEQCSVSSAAKTKGVAALTKS